MFIVDHQPKNVKLKNINNYIIYSLIFHEYKYLQFVIFLKYYTLKKKAFLVP